jgi:hypothetical protein
MSTGSDPALRGAAAMLPERLTLNGQLVDRRTFLGALALTTAALVMVRPGTASATSAAGGAEGPTSARPEAPTAGTVPEGTWHVDDMWGHRPRYAHPIPYTLVHHVPISFDTVALVDRMFVT